MKSKFQETPQWPGSIMQRLLTCLAIALSGCQLAPLPSGLLEQERADTNISSHQLRVMVNEYVLYFRDRVELSADAILAETSDVRIRKNALLWKINAISAAFQAAARPDPLGAQLDLWILNRQMTDLLASEKGRQLFGSWQPVAVQECERLEERISSIHRQLGQELRFNDAFVASFVKDYPVQTLYFDREPIATRYIEEVRTPGKELMHVVANLDENINELRKLTILYAEHLPKQVRWEAELLALDAEQWPVIQQPLEELARVSEVATSLARVAEQLPTMVAGERVALLAALERERRAAFAEIEQMRQDTMHTLQSERQVVLQAVASERQAIAELVDLQRQAAVGDLSVQLECALTELDRVSANRLQETFQEAPRIVDHTFRRLAQLLVVVLAMAGCVFFVRQALRGTQASPTHQGPAVAPATLAEMPDAPSRASQNKAA